MATYIPGVVDYIPQIQPFRPDYNFYANSLQVRQNRYDSAHKQLSSLYGSLLNSPMLRDENIQARDQFFKIIDQDIKRLANVDLSLQENVESAQRLFTQLYDNKNIVKDIVWTKNAYNQLKRGENFRNCVDPKKCGGSYWDGGIRAIQYKMEEFKNASPDKAMSFGDVRYVPYQNVLEKAISIAKEADLNIEYDEIRGNYIVSTKNGPKLQAPLQSLLQGYLGKDPAIIDYYKTKAYVDRKDWIASNLDIYENEEIANQAYIQKVQNSYVPILQKQEEQLRILQEGLSTKKKELEERISKEGTTSESRLAKLYRSLNNIETQTSSSLEVISEANNQIYSSYTQKMLDQIADNIDGFVAQYSLSNDISEAANIIAYKDFKYKITPDQFALERMRHANALALAATKHEYNKALEKYKKDLEKEEEQILMKGSQEHNIPIEYENTTGAYDINLSKDASTEQFEKQYEKFRQDAVKNEKSILREYLIATANHIKKYGSNSTEAREAVQIIDKLIRNNKDIADVFPQDTPLEKALDYLGTPSERLFKEWNSLSHEEKALKISTMDIDKIIAQNRIRPEAYVSIYDDLFKVIDMTDPANAESKKHLETLWHSTAEERRNIQANMANMKKLTKVYQELSEKTIANIRANTKYDPDFLSVMSEMYIDKNTGLPQKVDREEFIERFIRKKKGGLFENTLTGTTEFTGSYDQPYIDLREKGYQLYYEMNDIWREALSKTIDIETQNPDSALSKASAGLIGRGSTAAKGFKYASVDPVSPLSNSYIHTIDFLQNAMLSKEDSEVIFDIGNFKTSIPDNRNSAKTVVNQLLTDLKTKKKPSDDVRPILEVRYQNIAGGDEDWTGLNIRFNSDYLTKFESILSYDYAFLKDNGITIYLNKNKANNGFRYLAEKRPIGQIMDWENEYAITDYPSVSDDLKLIKLTDGSYTVTGTYKIFDPENESSIKSGENQGYVIRQFPSTIFDSTNSPDDIVNLVVQGDGNQIIGLKDIYQINAANLMQYNAANGIKDPTQLID